MKVTLSIGKETFEKSKRKSTFNGRTSEEVWKLAIAAVTTSVRQIQTSGRRLKKCKKASELVVKEKKYICYNSHTVWLCISCNPRKGWSGGLPGKGTCCQAWWQEVNSWHPLVEEGKGLWQVVLGPVHTHTHASSHMYTQIHLWNF